MKNITIEVPDNCKLIKEDDTTFKVITEREPKTWKDFCDIVPVINEYYIDQFSNVRSISSGKRDPMYDRNLCATREENDDLYLFRYKPYKSVRHWVADEQDPSKYRFRIDRELFPEITFYNNPKEVILQLKEKITKVSILNQTI